MVLAVPQGTDVPLTIDKATGKPLPQRHPVVSVGDWGIADSLLRPAGRARFGRNIVDVVSEGSLIEPGRQIRVIEIEGNRVVVMEIESNPPTV
jgi:membrane-bound serine protease (ClpP class)